MKISPLVKFLLGVRLSNALTINRDVLEIFRLDVRLSELERALIQEALAEAKGNRTLAAKLLGVTRNGLSMKIERLAIDI